MVTEDRRGGFLRVIVHTRQERLDRIRHEGSRPENCLERQAALEAEIKKQEEYVLTHRGRIITEGMKKSIRKEYKAGAYQAALACKYKIAQGTVSRIVRSGGIVLILAVV